MELRFNSVNRWSVKVYRVSLPQKLKKTSHFNRDVKDDDEEEAPAKPVEEIDLLYKENCRK